MTRPANDLRAITARLAQIAHDSVDGFRTYQANCRCPKCHEQKIWCTECDWCRANLERMVLAILPPAPVSSCEMKRDQAIIAPMNRKLGTKKKKLSRPKPKAKTRPKATATKKPVRRTGPKSGDSDRGLYVRFETPEIKAKVTAMANKTGVSMNAYIVAATLEWVKEGRTLELGPKLTEKKAS